MERTLYPVILVGGRGARLWPVSRESFPKVFQNLVSDKSLLQDTCLRFAGIAKIGAPIVVCNTDHVPLVREQLADIENLTILAEPVRRNTAPAIVAAGALLQASDPDAIMLVLPADHVITNLAAFHKAIESATAVACEGHLVTFGITPTAPETEYGYIKSGKVIGGYAATSSIEHFVEKPDEKTARSMLVDGGYSWNSGMFMFPVREMLNEMQKHAQDVLSAAISSVPPLALEDGTIYLDEVQFSAASAISIDYALMEKTSCAAVVQCDIGWSDVGNWNALWHLGDKDENGNVLTGDVVSQGSENSLIRSDGPLVVGIGLKDTVVVATDDAVLVGTQAQIRAVGNAVDRLADAKRKEASSHKYIWRPWGRIETVARGSQFQVNRLSVEPGQKCSLQTQAHVVTRWTIVAGDARITSGGRKIPAIESQSIDLPSGSIHLIENVADGILTIIEIQTGSNLGHPDD